MMYLADATLRHLKAVATWPDFADGRYDIVEEIGRGGMGTVYAARDTALERDVAVKIGNAVPSSDLHARLTREAQVLASLEHPGIVPVHDWGLLTDGRPFYVMKRVRGRTLREVMESEPALTERLRVFERVCEAVSFAHARGVIHRDLKPDNVMIGDFGEVMVMDFGISEGGAVMGTRGFMAPEQAAGAEIDERADVYALGAMLRTLLPHDAPKPLKSIAACAAADSPAARYSSVEALAADIASWRAGDAVRAHRETMAERMSRFTRAYRTPILLVLAYMVMRALIALL